MNQNEPAGDEAGAAAFEAEAAAAIAGLPDEALPGAAPDAGEGAAQVVTDMPWEPFLQSAARPLLFGLVLPQWEVEPEMQDQLTKALADCCDQLFPGGIDGKYGCFVRLAAVGTAIVGTRMAANGGKLPPIGPKRAEPAADGKAA